MKSARRVEMADSSSEYVINTENVFFDVPVIIKNEFNHEFLEIFDEKSVKSLSNLECSLNFSESLIDSDIN